MTGKYYPVTKDELDQIKNDCYYPTVLSCDGCNFEDEQIGCNWKGANVLMDEILERTPISSDGEPMELPEEMPFTSDEIPMRKFVITDAQLREYFDAWMYSDKDARRLTELNATIRDRVISVGHVSGMFCAACHIHKSGGYFLCEECFNKQVTTIQTETRNETLRKLSDMVLKELHIVPGRPFDPDTDTIPMIGVDELGYLIQSLREGEKR